MHRLHSGEFLFTFVITNHSFTIIHRTLLIVLIVDRTSTNSGCMVVEWMPSSWKNDFTCWEMRPYSCKLAWRHRMWAVAMIRLPDSCHTWNSCTSHTPSTCQQHHDSELLTIYRTVSLSLGSLSTPSCDYAVNSEHQVTYLLNWINQWRHLQPNPRSALDWWLASHE